MYVALARMTNGVQAAVSLERIDGVMRLVAGLTAEHQASAGKLTSHDEALISELVILPLKSNSLHEVLGLKCYTELVQEVGIEVQTAIASRLVKAAIESPVNLPCEDADRFFAFAKVSSPPPFFERTEKHTLTFFKPHFADGRFGRKSRAYSSPDRSSVASNWQ